MGSSRAKIGQVYWIKSGDHLYSTVGPKVVQESVLVRELSNILDVFVMGLPAGRHICKTEIDQTLRYGIIHNPRE